MDTMTIIRLFSKYGSYNYWLDSVTILNGKWFTELFIWFSLEITI